MSTRFLLPAALTTAAALAACAPRADSIAPVAMPPSAYTNVSCAQALSDRQRAQVDLAALSSQQNNAATGDALGVFFIGVPVSSLTGGDKSGLIAVKKGELLALDAKLAGC